MPAVRELVIGRYRQSRARGEARPPTPATLVGMFMRRAFLTAAEKKKMVNVLPERKGKLLVGGSRWIDWLLKLERSIVNGEVRTFSPQEREQALSWIAA